MGDLDWVIYQYYLTATDDHEDGLTQLEYKKKLYKIKWRVDELLQKCPTFVGEQEFLEINRREYESQ